MLRRALDLALDLTDRPRTYRGGCALLAVVLVAAVSAPAPASAGFFDFLFNPKAQFWNPFAPQPEPVQPIQRAAPVRKRKPPHLANRTMQLVEKTRPSGLPAASREIMDDRSLRDGDAVMTPSGIRIFIGPRGERHRPENFARLGEIKGLGKYERAALAAIDARGSGVNHNEAKPSLATGRSAASQVTAGTIITDPKGRTIRYVGP
jgi:hypothetical protein